MTEILLSGRGLLESIRWHDGRLYVSDWSAGEVLTVPGEVLLSVKSLPLCFDWLPDGRLVWWTRPPGSCCAASRTGRW